jgi:hypothetical protein
MDELSTVIIAYSNDVLNKAGASGWKQYLDPNSFPSSKKMSETESISVESFIRMETAVTTVAIMDLAHS